MSPARCAAFFLKHGLMPKQSPRYSGDNSLIVICCVVEVCKNLFLCWYDGCYHYSVKLCHNHLSENSYDTVDLLWIWYILWSWSNLILVWPVRGLCLVYPSQAELSWVKFNSFDISWVNLCWFRMSWLRLDQYPPWEIFQANSLN